MNARQRFFITTHFGKPDRVPNEDFGYWDDTLERWYTEGLPKGVDVENHLCLDPRRENYLLTNLYLGAFPEKETKRPIYIGPLPLRHEVLHEDANTVTLIDVWGIKKRVKKSMPTIPQFLEFPVKTMEDFRLLRKKLEPDDPERFTKNWSKLIREYRLRDHVLGIQFAGFFGHPRNLMGLENLSIAYYRNPELVHAIQDHWCDFCTEISRRVLESVELDFVQFWEDMAYNKGSLVSPSIFRKFMTPYYKKLTRFFKENGVDVIMVDCDGDVNDLIPLFMESGVNGIYPLEVRCNVDPVALRRKYGKTLILAGGIDKFALVKGPEAIDEELNSKIPVLVPQGGYIPTVDHRVPPDVSFSNYHYYVKLKTKLILEAAM